MNQIINNNVGLPNVQLESVNFLLAVVKSPFLDSVCKEILMDYFKKPSWLFKSENSELTTIKACFQQIDIPLLVKERKNQMCLDRINNFFISYGYYIEDDEDPRLEKIIKIKS